MAQIIISHSVQQKLNQKHGGITKNEISQCFENRCGEYLVDDREDNRTDPATLWFISETNKQRQLKVVFISQNGNVYIKTAYEPNDIERNIYEGIAK